MHESFYKSKLNESRYMNKRTCEGGYETPRVRHATRDACAFASGTLHVIYSATLLGVAVTTYTFTVLTSEPGCKCRMQAVE